MALPQPKRTTPEMLAAKVELVKDMLLEGKTYKNIGERHSMTSALIKRIANSPEVKQVMKAKGMLMADEMYTMGKELLKELRGRYGELLPHQMASIATKLIDTARGLQGQEDAPETKRSVMIDTGEAKNVQIIIENITGKAARDIEITEGVQELIDQVGEET